jgi:hypothetical protein
MIILIIIIKVTVVAYYKKLLSCNVNKYIRLMKQSSRAYLLMVNFFFDYLPSEIFDVSLIPERTSLPFRCACTPG